jgi:hypothetical protein
VPALDLAIRLWIVRGGSDVGHARDANELEGGGDDRKPNWRLKTRPPNRRATQKGPALEIGKSIRPVP